jgi:AcrR family transcriptional regulator
VQTQDGTRERNTQERRDALVHEAYVLFRERGYANTTMDDIAARVGLSRRTAFRYFATKEDLVFPAMQERTQKLTRLLVPEDGERSFDTVMRACLAMARDYQSEREFLLAQWEIVRHEPARQAREHVITPLRSERREACGARVEVRSFDLDIGMKIDAHHHRTRSWIDEDEVVATRHLGDTRDAWIEARDKPTPIGKCHRILRVGRGPRCAASTQIGLPEKGIR